MNNKQLRKIAKVLAKTQETTYMEVNKHPKMIRQAMSADVVKKRLNTETGDFDMSGFSKDSNYVPPNLLETVVTVSQRILDPECFRGKYKALKRNWRQIFNALSPELQATLLNTK